MSNGAFNAGLKACIKTIHHGKATHLVRPAASSLVPTVVQERQRELLARMKRAKVPASEMPHVNSTMGGTYRTGDGDVVQLTRPGAMRAFGLPSRGMRG